MDNLSYVNFYNINLNDNFFNSLKNDYQEFPTWFTNKVQQGEGAYLLTNDEGNIEGFMYLKNEIGEVNDINPSLPNGNHLKVGTFKFESKGTRRGERFLKKIFDVAIGWNVDDIYVTVFEEHGYLIKLFGDYGFVHKSTKDTPNGQELVLVRNLRTFTGDSLKDFPFLHTQNRNKFLLGIYPIFHSRMLPDSILNNESHDIIQDVSHTNSIHKIYICGMHGVTEFKPGDIIVIYRTKDNKGPAYYRSVVTSVCVFEEYLNVNQFTTCDSFIQHCRSYSIFSDHDLRIIYNQKKYTHILKFTYNTALTKRLTQGCLIDTVGLDPEEYWGVRNLTDDQFKQIAQLGGINEGIIID
jgi:hypothetical protein